MIARAHTGLQGMLYHTFICCDKIGWYFFSPVRGQENCLKRGLFGFRDHGRPPYTANFCFYYKKVNMPQFTSLKFPTYTGFFFSFFTIAESTRGITDRTSPTRIVKWNPERKTAGSRSVNAVTPPAAVADVSTAA